MEVALLAFVALKCVEAAPAAGTKLTLAALQWLVLLVWLSSVTCGVGCLDDYDSI
jgi:hypothetical protein